MEHGTCNEIGGPSTKIMKLGRRMLIVESYKHIGELTCGGKAKYFARCVFAILCACFPCVYIFIHMSPFSPFYMQLDMLIHQLLKEFKTIVQT